MLVIYNLIEFIMQYKKTQANEDSLLTFATSILA